MLMVLESWDGTGTTAAHPTWKGTNYVACVMGWRSDCAPLVTVVDGIGG